MQHENRVISALRHIVICGLPRSTILSSVDCPALPYCHLWTAALCHIVICGLPRSTILSSVDCPALPYCHLWTAALYHIVICGLPRSTILSSVDCPALQYFPTLSHKRHDFRKKSVLKWSEVKGSVVKCSVGKGWKRGVMGRVYMGGKVVRIEGLG